MTEILDRVPLTGWCQETADKSGLELEPHWREAGFGNRTYAGLVLKVAGADGQPPLQGHCAVVTGSSQTGDPDVLALSLDLILQLPLLPSLQSTEDSSAPVCDKLDTGQLVEIIGIVTRSAIEAAGKAAAELLDTSTDDGHVAIWLDSTGSFDDVLDLDAFPTVGNQSASNEVSVFSRLPFEPGQPYDSADFNVSLRGAAVELLHELLRGSQRRNFTEALHSLRDASFE